MASWQHSRARIRQLTSRFFERPIVRILSKVGITPNQISIVGLIASVGAAYLLAKGEFRLAALILILAGTLDMIDGALARLKGLASSRGALIDSTSDRVAEAVVFLGLLAFYINSDSTTNVWLIYLAMIGSFMVSYLRARGEGLGIDCKVGIMTRPERVLVLTISLLVQQVAIGLIIISCLSYVTAIQRLRYIFSEISGNK